MDGAGSGVDERAGVGVVGSADGCGEALVSGGAGGGLRSGAGGGETSVAVEWPDGGGAATLRVGTVEFDSVRGAGGRCGG